MAKNAQRDLQTAILEEARAALLAKGYAYLSMRRIARAVGCTATSIYLHFESKDDLVHALIDEGFERLYAELRAAAEGIADPVVRLERLCRRYVEFGLENPAYYEVMFMLRPDEMTRYPAEKYRRARRNLELFAEVLGHPLRETKVRLRDTGVDHRVLTTIIWASVHGVVALLLAQRIDASIDRKQLIDDLVAHAIGMLATTTARAIGLESR